VDSPYKCPEDRFATFNTAPKEGPFRNTVIARGAADPVLAQPLDIAHVQPDGRVVLRAEGPPLGGQGYTRGGFERRPAGGGTPVELAGIGAYYGTDHPGPGQWEYRAIAVDEQGNRSEGPWRAVTVPE